MKIEIHRTFNRKVQLEKFSDYIEVGCSAGIVSEEGDMKMLGEMSQSLSEFVEGETMKEVEKFRPSLKESGKPKVEVQEIALDETERDSDPEILEA